MRVLAKMFALEIFRRILVLLSVMGAFNEGTASDIGHGGFYEGSGSDVCHGDFV